MKITKRQLKRIIKEELGRVMEGSDEAIEAFNDYIQRKDPGGSRGNESNLVRFIRHNRKYLDSLPAIAAHYEFYKEDLLSAAGSGRTGQMIADALADYEDPAPEGDPLGDLPYEDPADRPDPFADLMQ